MSTAARDVDEVKVQRRIDGDTTIRLNIGEKREAIRILHTRGLSDGQIAQTIGHATKVVYRIRRELELPANFDTTGQRVISR